MIQTISAKLGGMRKPQSFVVYPFKPDEPEAPLIVQSDRVIGQFDRQSGSGMLNWRGPSHKGFPHLSRLLGAEPYQFPAEFVQACLSAQPKPWDTIGNGVVRIA